MNQLNNDSVAAGGDGQKNPNFGEVAIIAQQLLLGNFDRLLPNDDTLLTRGGGDPRSLKIYTELLRDPKVYEKMQSRTLALTSRNWQVTPPAGDTSRQAKKAADMVRSQLSNLGFDRLSTEMQTAVMCGIAPHEIMWAIDGSEIVASEALSCEPWLFNFKRSPDESDATFARCGVKILTPSNSAFGEPVPHKKFMFHRFGGLYNNPWGLGLGNSLFWPVFFKRQGIQFWLSFAERFGTPVPIGKYPNNATPTEKSTLKAALRAFQREASLMVPAGMDITLLEAAKSGIDTYERLCRYMDDQISGIITGQPGGVAGGGQLASAINVNNEVRLELVKADADNQSETQFKQLTSWIVSYNMPGAPIPHVARDVVPPKDLQALAGTKKILFDMGFRPTLKSIVADFGGEYTEIPTALAQNRIPTPEIAEFSVANEITTPIDQAAVDSLISSLAQDKMQALMEQMLMPIIASINQQNDHKGALEKLVALFPAVPIDDLQKSLAEAMWVCHTLGQIYAEPD